MVPPTSPSRGPSWRFLRGWEREELEAAFERAADASRNFDPRPGAMAREGFRHVCSRARITVEPPGPPGQKFERLWEAIQRFEHSDPRIVVPHFRPQDRLRGRIVLLELRVLGLRYLCPVRIAAVRSHANEVRTLRAIAIDTLEGHLERGREWFFLRKEHATGEVRFRLQAAWSTGDFPNGWSHFGFLVLAPRYQRAWHRLAHLRLRRIAAGLEPQSERKRPSSILRVVETPAARWTKGGAAGGASSAEGEVMPKESIRFYTGKKRPRGLGIEREEQEMMKTAKILEPIFLGAYSGIRSMAGPALALRSLERRGKPPHRVLARALSALAANEFLLDKLPVVPPRTHPFALAARAVSGAFVASVASEDSRPRALPGILGAASAVASAFVFTRLRTRVIQVSKVAGYAFALTEDALAYFAQRRMMP